MAHKTKYPNIPKLYKVLSEGKSCNGGTYTWNTNGGLNTLPPAHVGRPLRHCSIGFHLTTDWRKWYEFGRDVYTAKSGNYQMLVQINDPYSGSCGDKVVVESCTLHDKNKDPVAKLFADFHADVVAVGKALCKGGLPKNGKAPAGAVLSSKISPGNRTLVYHRAPTSLASFAGTGSLWHQHFPYYPRAEMAQTIRAILPYLVKSVDEKITEEERKWVHKLWNLWKAGWKVVGVVTYGDHKGKFIVDRS